MGRISARFFLLEALFGVLFLLALPTHAFARLSACSATISPDRVNVNSSGNNVTFTVYNNDDSGHQMKFIQVLIPNGNFTVESDAFFNSFDPVDPGSFISPTVLVRAGSTPVDTPQDWTVQATDDTDGNGLINCDGNLGMLIVDTAPPQILNVVVSDISNTSAVITWTTNKNASSELDYGETSDYGFTKSDATPSTSHSYALDSLSASTTYHFNIKATDDLGTTELGDNSFITAEDATVTLAPVTVTVTTTKTVTVTPSPTPTPVPDTTPPTLYLSTSFAKPFMQPPQITGTATDNKAVTKVEYSLDGGHNWLAVDTAPNLGKTSTTFSFLPPALDDGNYSLQVRGTDSSNNVGTSKIYTMVIDRLPPQVSGVMFSLGPQIVNPGQGGSLTALMGQPLKLTLSEVGGATSIDVFVDDTGKLDSKKFSLTKNPDSGLWSGNLIFPKTGQYQLRFSALDGAGNKTDRNLNKVMVVDKGKISGVSGEVANARVTVYYQEPVTNSWEVWDGGAYSQNNPQTTDASGNYSLFLPKGRYYLHIQASGFKEADSEFFNIVEAEPVNASFNPEPLKLLFALGPFKFYLPDFTVLSLPFKNNLPDVSQTGNSLVNQNAPFFNLNVANQDQLSSDSLTGKPTVITFLNTWSPSSSEQVSVLNDFGRNNNFNSTVISEGEKVSKVFIFQKRGGYALPIYADPDATLAGVYSLSVLPVHYFLDRKGVVKKVLFGALNENELANTLVNISQ